VQILSKDPKSIHPAYKEAVVDGLLNGLAARVAGRGEFYKVIYGAKPSVTLMSEFLVPMPLEERLGDEEADPIRISAHGLDFQIRADAIGSKMEVSVTGAVYVRILPSAEDVRPGARLEPTFPLTSAARGELRAGIRDALAKLMSNLPNGKANHDWPIKSLEARKAVYAAKGLPFENERDRSSSAEQEEGEPTQEDTETAEGESRPIQEVTGGGRTPDALAEPIPPPPKWLRLDLVLPSFSFTASAAAADARAATDALNASIAKQIADWVASTDPNFGGQLWGYRKCRVKPSDVKDWNAYLAGVRASKLAIVVPTLDLRWVVTCTPDAVDGTRQTIHVALENWSDPVSKATFKEIEPAIFQVSVAVNVPAEDHCALHLDRVKPSYRYNQYLKYPALGFNGGVTATLRDGVRRLATTWAPRYVLPRIIPTERQIERRIGELAQPGGLAGLKPLVLEYEDWLKTVEKQPVDLGLEGPKAEEQKQAERAKLLSDLACWRSELGAIKCGLEILEFSRGHWSGPGPQKNAAGIPFEAWVCMNAAMAKVASAKGYSQWRLFQVAFILASIPAFATRIPAFHAYYTAETARDANAVTLLYFSTGGGKSEAFLGLLLFVLFLDRLRGKELGVTALMRYPLRLLTLQQARRTFTAMAAAEEIRHSRQHGGEPFSLGFWVGGSNTPNWHIDEAYDEVPKDKDVPPLDEPSASQAQPYKSARERWLKLTSCPFCGAKGADSLALRRHTGDGANALGHYCTSPRDKCSWNARFSRPTPLPFYIVDEDIYALAPSVLLGTVDKLAAIGQSQGTIRKFFGMFGFAPLKKTGSNRLYVPMKAKDWDGLPGPKARGLYPTFTAGDRLFFDPFPALLIQDEAHLLDESLGTFSGLFESALEAAFDELAPLLKGQISYEPNSTRRRRIKVIAASATVSEPVRQMRHLYQRDHTVQFPFPGPSLYESFYAVPMPPDASADDIERVALAVDDIELRSHWARVYCSLLTNGHRHTVAMASVLGHYHLMVTCLYDHLRSGDPLRHKTAQSELLRWISPGALHAQHSRLIGQADSATLLTLIDLHRITLTYVTNKKGGDQVIDTEKVQFEKLHRAEGINDESIASELISGAVSAAQIQDIVRRAEARVGVNQPFPPLGETLRSVIATSAISHGVDVEEFNAMFFAGIPSDIAEYIQASSRVGRTHVGFSLLVPVPQRYRDRFVLEIHDIFHRFLERMILPAAIDRWAEKALVRVMPSFFQEYVCGIDAIKRLAAADDAQKPRVDTHAMAPSVRDFVSDPNNLKAIEVFMEKALGLAFLPAVEGATYYKALLKDQLARYQQDLNSDRLVNSTLLVKFFALRNSLLRPMTSLRDVDVPGVIREARSDCSFKPAKEGATARAMTFIRRGSGADIDSTDSEAEFKKESTKWP
jgi:hypothetical protein